MNNSRKQNDIDDEKIIQELVESLNKILLKEDNPHVAFARLAKKIQKVLSVKNDAALFNQEMASLQGLIGHASGAPGAGPSNTEASEAIIKRIAQMIKDNESYENILKYTQTETKRASEIFNKSVSASASASDVASETSKAARTASSEAGLVRAPTSNIPKVPPVTVEEVKVATQQPAKMFALFERTRVAIGSPPVQKFIGILNVAGKALAVLGAGIYAWKLSTNPKELTVDEHILGGASVVEVGGMLASVAGYGSVAAAASAVAGGAAIGAIIGLGINKLGSYVEEKKAQRESDEVSKATGQKAVEMFKSYCQGGYDRNKGPTSTLGAIGKSIIGMTIPGRYFLSGKGEKTPGSWGMDDIDDMAILYNTILKDPSIQPQQKKDLAKCFAGAENTIAGDRLKRRGIIITPEGLMTEEELARKLNDVIKQTPTIKPETKPETKPEILPGHQISSSGKSVKCEDVGATVKFQKWIKTTYKQNICADGKIGRKTFKASKSWDMFPFKQTFDELKNDQREMGILCHLMSDVNAPWKNFDPTPEKCLPKKGKLIRSDVPVPAVPIEAGGEQLGISESYNFYDKQKIKDANLLYEKLIKLYTDKEKL